jgi:MFS family permease
MRVPALLREDARFRAFWCGQTASLAGDQIGLVALPLTGVIALHAGPGAMGLLTAAGWLPSLLLSLHAGAWVDRSGHRREAMIAADLGRAGLLATVPVAAALGVLTFAQLAIVAFLAGALGALASVATSSLYAALVPRERLVEGGALVNGSRAGTGVAGPSAGGALVAALGGPVALLGDAVSFLASAWWLRRVRAPVPPPGGDDDDAGRLADGARYVARSPLVRSTLAATATLNLFTLAISALFAVYAVRALGVSAGALGVVLGLGATGAVLGSVLTGRIVARIGFGPAFMLGCVLFPAPMLLVPLAAGPHALVLALLVLAEAGSGFGVMVLDISVGAILAAAVPDGVRARVSGAYQLANYGVRPLGALAGGALAAAIGMRTTLWLATAGALLAVLWTLPSPLPRLRSLPRADQAGAARGLASRT